jgi:NhaP-type Na+/H+ or K+/H+ antiporter
MKTKISASLFVLRNYFFIALMLVAAWALSNGVMQVLHSNILPHTEILEMIPLYLDIVIIFALGFTAYELAKSTVIPSFVLAIFFGFVSQNALSFITQNGEAVSILTTIGAVLILFGGGLETPFTRFRSLIGPIVSLAFAGTILTAIGLSLFFGFASPSFGFTVPFAAVVLLGVSVASTDPAAIIPSFKQLLFKQPRVKHIAVSESALNDVIGALLTAVFLALFTSGVQPSSVLDAYGMLLNFDNLLSILKVIAIGAGVGFVAYYGLHLWSNWKERLVSPGEADAALFLAVPLFAFTLATALGGNGFLAVFVAGLLFQLRDHFAHVEHFFNHTIEGFMKPLIFMILGTMVDFSNLVQFAGIGIVTGLLFMFVLRPLVVFITLAPFTLGKEGMSVRELLFLSFVRETGVIPAVLLVGIGVAGIPGSDVVVAVGMWIILLTLMVQPPFTPMVAKALGIAEDLPPFPKQKSQGPIAVLCSRGYTFLERIETVVEWCLKHGVANIVLLHCPEDKYTEKFMTEVREVADVRFKSINNRLSNENRKEMNFKFLGRPGKLEENIESLLSADEVAIVFVGSKMLDYRIKDVKRLQVPFVFLK